VGATGGIGFMLLGFEFGSAGTTLAYAVSVGLFLMLFSATRSAGEILPGDRFRRVLRGAGGLVLALPAVVGLALTWGPAGWREALWETHVGEWIREKSAIRIEGIRASLEATGDFWLLGAGGGATDRVLPPYVDWSVIWPARIRTIENEPVEWLFHYGIPAGLVGIALLVGYFWFVYRRYANKRRFRYVAALSVAVYLGIAAQFHFPFFALGISIPGILLLEGLAFPTRSEEPDVEDEPMRVDRRRGMFTVARRVRWGALAATVAVGLLFAAGGFGYDVELAQFGEDWETAPEKRDYERLARIVPSDGDLYVHAAFAALDAGDGGAAARRATHGFEREPKANIGLLVGGILSRAGREDEADRMYRQIFAGDYIEIPGAWVRNYVLPQVREPERLGGILAEAEPRHWEAVASAIRERRGPERAAQFGLALHDHRPEAFVPNRIVVENYLEMGQGYLAETWVRTMMQGAAATAAERAMRAELLARILRARGDEEAAREEVFEALANAGAASLDLAKQAVELRPTAPGAATETQVQALATARKVVCGGNGDGLRKTCWRAEAWLKEYTGDYRGAASVYEGLTETTGDPTIYAEYLNRRGRCGELEEFVDEQDLQGKRGDRWREKLVGLTVDCGGE